MAERRAKTFSITTIPGFTMLAIITFLVLYAPIATLVIYSFNGGTSVAAWGGFSTPATDTRRGSRTRRVTSGSTATSA